MSNWWEAYPAVSADEMGIQTQPSKPQAEQAVAVADKPEQVADQSQDKWWEAYPALRADVGPKAMLAGIEDDKKKKEDQARLHAAHQSIENYGETATVAGQVVTDVASTAERLIGMGDRADQVNRDSEVLDQALRERDAARWKSEQSSEGMSLPEQAGQYIPFLKQGVRGAARSAASAVIGSKGAGALLGTGRVAVGAARGAVQGARAAGGVAGTAAGAARGAIGAAQGTVASEGLAYGAIGLASAQEANRAITEGTDAGLTGSALASYVASRAMIEAAPAMLMQRLGLGGVESLIAGPAIRGGVKAGIIEVLKRFPEESIEELATEGLHAVATEYSGLDPRALDSDRLSSMVADTLLQTAIMSVGAGAARTVQGAAQERLARLQAMRAKGFVSAEDAAKEGIGGKNRKERKANFDAEIEQLTKESESTTQQGEVLPTVGTTPPSEGELGSSPQSPQPQGPTGGAPGQPGAAVQPPVNGTQLSVQRAQDRFRTRVSEQREREIWSDPSNPLQFAISDPKAAAELANKPTYLTEDFEQSLGVAPPDPKLRRQWKTWLKEAISLEPDVVSALQQEPGNTLSYNWTRVADGVQPPRSESVEVKQTAFGTLIRLKPPKAQSSTEQSPVDLAAQPAATGLGATPIPNPNPADTPSTAGSSEGTGTKPTTGLPTVSSDAPATPETSMGETGGKTQPSEARADTSPAPAPSIPVSEWDVGRRAAARNALQNVWVSSPLAKLKKDPTVDEVIAEVDKAEAKSKSARVADGVNWQDVKVYAAHRFKKSEPTVDRPSPTTTAGPGESKWHAETRTKLEAVPAFNGAKIEPDEKAGTVKVTRADGLATTVHFDADDRLAQAAKKLGKKQLYGLYFRKNGEVESRIYIHSKANHANIINHEVMHWLEDQGVVSKDEVEQHGGTEEIAKKYGAWIAAKSLRKKNSIFQKIYDALEPLFSSQARFFEEVGSRQAPKPQENLSEDKKSSAPKPPEGYKPLEEFTPSVTQILSPDLSAQENLNEMKKLNLKPGDAVGFRVYPNPKSTKGGYWQYGTVSGPPAGSHAAIQLADGTKEMVAGSRLHKLYPTEKQHTEAKPVTPASMGMTLRDRVVANVQEMYDTKNYSEDGILATIKREVDAQFGKLTTEVAEQGSLTDDVRDWINGFDASKFTGSVRAYLRRQEKTTKPSADQVNVDSGVESKVKIGDIIKSDGRIGVVTRVKDDGMLSVDFEETTASGRKVSPRYAGFNLVRPGEYTVVGPSPFPATLETFYKQFGGKSPEQVKKQALELWNSLDDDDKSRFAHRLRRFGIAGAKKNSTPETLADSISNVISQSEGVPGKLREVYDIAMEYPQLDNIFNDPKQMELNDEMLARIDAVGLSLPPMVRAVLPALLDMRMEVLHNLAKQQFGQEIADALFEDVMETAEGDALEKLPQAIPAYVISGLQRSPGRIDDQKLTGRSLGVAVGPQRMSANVIRKIAAHVDRGGTLFVDSGMFGTVKAGKIGEEPNWANVFEEYGRVLDAVEPANRRNIMLVAPDFLVKIETADGKELIIGDPFRTLELQRQHRLSIEELLDQGARVIIPLQRDMSEEPMGLGETASLASDNVNLTSGNFAWGIPYNEAAWPDEDILGFVRDQKGESGSGMHLHLLGGGKSRAEKLWEQIKAIDPTVKLTGDAASEARNAYRAENAQTPPAESGGISMEDFADIFEQQVQSSKPKPAAKPKAKKQPASGKSTGRKDPKEGIAEGLNEAKEGADLIRKALKDLGTNFFAGPPINADLARGMGMLANGLIKAGRYKFAEFIESAVEMIGAPAVRYLGPHLEVAWNRIAAKDDRLDKATSVIDILAGKEPEALYTVEGEEGMIARVFKHKDGFSVNVTDTDSGMSGDQIRIFPTLEQAKEYADTINATQKTTPANERPAKATSAQVRIANRVRDALENGQELTSQVFFGIADEEFGGKRSNNDYGDSQATDALELGVNLYLQGKTDANVSAEEAKATLDRIAKVMELVPRHRGRTGNKDLMQQFSTPPAYAYAVNWIANVAEGDVVLEPSAGMGGIAIHAANSGATVYGNELDPERAAGLRELPMEKVFTEDAEQIGAILKGKMPGLNVVIMNPPFSRAGMRMGDRMVQGTDRKHIDEALTLLPEGGRLVAIVGGGLHKQGQKMTQWLDNLPYQLVANIEVAREVYRGYGTEFPTRVLVIDKVPSTDSTLVRSVESLSELIDVAGEVRDARPVRSVEQNEDESDSEQGAAEDGQGTGAPDDTLDTTTSGVPGTTDSGTGQANDGQREPDRTDSGDDGSTATGTTGTNAGGGRGGRGGGRSSGKSGRSSKGSKSKPSGDAPTGKSKSGRGRSSDRKGGLTKAKAKSQPRAQSVKTELGTSTFEDYVPSVVVEGASPHPAPIVESAAMSAVDAPRIDYEVDLMPGVFEGYVNEDGVYVGISDIQLEAIAMAGAAHEQMLPSGERRGFLIGDGTGVGKAREALGIIMDDFIKRGTGARRKAVLITKNDGLVKDAVGEWVGVGGDPAEMQALSNVGSGEAVNYESGVLTLSYDTLKGEASVVAKSNGNMLSRVDQIIEWVGPDFDGVVVFDEAHLMANSLDTGVGNQAKGASMRALAGVDLQQRLPNARFVYLSATAATEVRNLAYAERLGLWGPETSFATKHAFINEIEAGGVAAMEKVAADMKAMGMYVARNLSFDDGTEKGRVEFDRIMHTLSDDQRRVYDKLSEAWLKVLADIDTALDITNNERGKSRILSAFWSSNQRFWNDVVTTMMAPTLIQNIEKDLAAGRSVVIQLSTTKEAATSRAIAGMKEGQTYDEIDASPRRSLMEYVDRAFPTQRHETYIDDAGNERTRPVVDSEGKPVHDPAAVAMKERLLDEIGSLDVAARGPIDMILDHFGLDMAAEISGRSQRLVKGEDGRLELEKRGKASARADRDAFMDGKKRILMFSEAGGTGASYHASLSAANQQRRSHYLWQPGWSAPVAVQGLGRAHRSNQASAPILHLLEPNLEGYKRFISTIARRLGQLGALTKGQRTAADAGLFGANDNLESTEANGALFQFMRDAVMGNIEGIDREFLIRRLGLEQLAGEAAPTPEMFTITQFLNRMLNLPLGEQNQVFKAFQSRMDSIVAQAIQDGTLDQGMETLKAEKIVKANETIVNEHKTGAKTKLVELTVTHKVKLRSYEDMLREVAGYTQFGLEGFYKSKTSGKVMAVINQNRTSQDDKGRTLHDAMTIGVDGNTYGHSIEQFEKDQYWEELSRDQAKKLWDEQFAKAPTTRDSTDYLLTGALLPIWNKIPGERSRVVRALTADGEMILGRVVPERMLQRTLDSLGIAGEQKQYTPQQGIQAIYQGGTVELVNGWTIKKRTIDGEDNIEIIGPDYASNDAIINAGGFKRRIDYTTRYFIPFDDTEGDILGEITRISPIASITSPRGGRTAQMATPTRQSRSGGGGGIAARVAGEGIAAADIQKTAARLFDVAIRHGNFSQRAAGIYKWMTRGSGPKSPEVVRTAEKHYANVAVIAHEIAHHIDERTKAVQSMPANVKQEVARLDYEPQKARAFEGWAEFLRRYMTEPPIDVNGNMLPNPAIDAPQTLAWFETKFLQAHPDVAKAIAEFRKYAQQFANQSVFARIGTMIADRKPQDLQFSERWKQKAKRALNRLKTNFQDKFHTLEWIQTEAKEKGYKGVGIYDLTMAYFLSASSHATIAFEEGVRSLMTGKQIGKTKLWDLSRHLKNDGEYDEAIRYALARHTLYMDDVKPGYNTGVDVEDAQAWVDEAESLGKADRYEEFAQELAQFNDDLLKMLVNAGALSSEDAKKMTDYYRDANGSSYYFPLHRISDFEKSEFAGTSAGFVNLGQPVKGRSKSGSGRQIIDPIDATVTRAIKFYGRAIQARQAHTLAQTLDPLLGGVGGMGGLMDRVPAKRAVHHGTIEEILNTLVESGTIDADMARAMRVAARIRDPGNGLPSQRDLDWFAKKHNIANWANNWFDMELAAEREPDALAVISLWRPDYTPSAQKRTVMIYDRSGEKLMYEMDDELYQVATGMQEIQFNSFMNILREGSRYFKTGAVGLSTGFGTANLLRDYWEFQGKANHVKGLRSLGKPWQMLGRYVAEKTKQSMVGKYVGKKIGVTYKPNNALIRLYEESGGKVYSVVGHDADGRSIYRRKKLGKSTMSKLGLSLSRPMDTANNVLSNLQELIAMSDAPPRLADAEAALAEHGFKASGDKWLDTKTGQIVDHLPESARIAAAVAMSEATINFKRIGAAGPYVEAFVPFFNASIQATYRQYQQMKNLKSLGQDTPEGDRALRTLVYLSALASMGVLYWLLRHDDDDYRNQDAWLRDGYWTWGADGKTYLRIPKPRDFAVVSNVAENMLDAWAHEDARETSDILLRDIGSRIPSGGGMPRAVVETYIADYDYFRGRELEGESVKDIPKPYRTSPYTSRMSDYLGKQFGKALNTSPIQFQHLLNSATGGMYGRLTDTYDAAQDGRLGPEHIPFARGLLIDRRQTRPIGEFYQMKADLEETAATQKIESGQASTEVADKLASFGWMSELMTSLRKDEGKLGKKRTFENEKYITGLARAALGYEEQESNPNPLTAKDLPDRVRETIEEAKQLVVSGAAERLSPRAVFKSDKNYTERKTQIERAETKFKMLDMTLDEAKEALMEHWKKTTGSEYETVKGQTVLKEALRTRLRKLEELFKDK